MTGTPCSIDDCVRPVKARTWCQTHYMRHRRHGDPTVSLINREHAATCGVQGCERPYRSNGLCFMHWQRVRDKGDVGPAAALILQYGPDDTCSADGCGSSPQRRWMCEAHADEVDQATPRRSPAGSGYMRADGYIEVRLPESHPLARGGRTLLHRVALWDKIGPGQHPCNWCARTVRWCFGLAPDALVADHVDFDTTNNDPANLVPSCTGCNTSRSRT